MKIKVDEVGRLVIPKDIRYLMGIESEVYIHLTERKELILSVEPRRTIKEAIEKRLKNKDLGKGERNFLENIKNNL